MKTIILVFLVFILCGCAAITKHPHPELDRVFRPGIDTPGEYPYCRQYNKEIAEQSQMLY